MKKEYYTILSALTNYDSQVRKGQKPLGERLKPHLELEISQMLRFHSYTTFLVENGWGDFEKYLEEFLDANSYRKKMDSESQNILEQMPYDFRKMLTNLKKDIKKYDDQKSNAMYEYVCIRRKILNCDDIDSDPLTLADIDKFIDILEQFASVRTTINNYLAIACIIKKTFMCFKWDSVTEILNSCGVKMTNPPNSIDASKYILNSFDYRVFTSVDVQKTSVLGF